jgi:asparagine synthase (glutamine-hydrolysing)
VSGIAGILHLDGAPVQEDQISKLAAGIAGRGPQGLRAWNEGPVALVHAHGWTTPEEVGEQQPIAHSNGRLWIAADARIDNRSELIQSLGAGRSDRTQTDAALILAAYEAWGDDSLRRLVGDFAFILWDAHRHRLLCARDPIGLRLLHYYKDGHRLIVASSVAAILGALESPPPINQALVRDLLEWRFDRWTDETSYQGIRRLPPSYRLEVGNIANNGQTSLTRYWTFGAEPQPAFRNDGDYVSRFQELFREAVRARLRSTSPVGLLVSGGLDSSAIACEAERVLAAGESTAQARLYSCVFEQTPGAEEREYAEEVARRCTHIPATFLPSDDCWGLREFGEEGQYPLTEPELSVSRALVFRPVRAASADGCRVVLTGIGGDQVLGGEPYHTPAMLRDVGLRHWLGEIPHFLGSSRIPLGSLLSRAYVRPGVRSALSRLGLRKARSARNHDLLPPPRLRSQASRASYRYLTEATFSARLLTLDVTAEFLGIEWRLPFLDRRLIEFLLALPARLRFRDGWIKFILREALKHTLPEKVRARTRLVHFLELETRGLHGRERRKVQALLQDSRVFQLGLADRDSTHAAWESYLQREGEGQVSERRRLIGFLCVEAWLRYREQSRVGDLVPT